MDSAPQSRKPEAFPGLLSASIAISLKNPLTNIAGWQFIIIRQPFTAGDSIQIGNQAGEVINFRQDIWERILKKFANHLDIGPAYPTQRFYTLAQQQENQPGSIPFEDFPEK